MAKRRRIPVHDSIVRNVFGRRRAFAVLLYHLLPAALLPYVDFDSIRPGPTVRTDDELRTRASDLCFTVDLVYHGRRYTMHVPVEHQCNLACFMPWRALVYLGDLWRGHIKDHPGRPYRLPFVLPILILQYPARNTPVRLTNILAMPPELRRLLGAPVELTLLVDDLSGSVLDVPIGDPATRALVELTRAFLHAHKNPGSLTKARLTTLAEQLEILLARNSPDPDAQTTGLDDVRALWKYVIEVFGERSPLRTLLLKAVDQPIREEFMTMKEAWLARGEKKGLAKGLATAVLDLLELRAVPVPPQVRKRVLATRDEPLLRRWLARALTVPSAEALLEPLEA